ncbi:hypothetical protein [Chitinimonas sp. BJB300]|uniref:hypothetical protein n=1 Tax=Chitinimonas sp. BJB300 TaxID=1559339 RepID=UPI000C0F4B8C|nr:hypothetical protein [Chitinimonas sp. BJB300]PHV10900.1 hypothetical protein CSQ89_13790 [Chitinimonas sp. BJB300]TSJ88187.1 hypothetical protein FG002_011795 [Chitinimonas sp. BJB300]
MYNSIEVQLTQERIVEGGIYWHARRAKLVRVIGLEMRFDGVMASYELVASREVRKWCFVDALRSHKQVKADFQASRMAMDAFAALAELA